VHVLPVLDRSVQPDEVADVRIQPDVGQVDIGDQRNCAVRSAEVGVLYISSDMLIPAFAAYEPTARNLSTASAHVRSSPTGSLSPCSVQNHRAAC
jgi:hypothetical protein